MTLDGKRVAVLGCDAYAFQSQRGADCDDRTDSVVAALIAQHIKKGEE